MAKLKSREVKQYAEQGAVAVVPCGSIEQHGRHLPLDVDSLLVFEIAKKAASDAAPEFPVLVTPPVTFGCSGHHMDFSGTITLSQGTFICVIKEICTSLIRHGLKKILILNGHSGNTGAVSVSVNEVKLTFPESLLVFFNYWAMAGEVTAGVRNSGAGGMAHACEFETSLYLALDPERVETGAAVMEIPEPRLTGERIDLLQWGRINVAFTMAEITRSGVLGDPLKATPEKGRQIFSELSSGVAAVLREMFKAKARL